jgi:hypothetical protein
MEHADKILWWLRDPSDPRGEYLPQAFAQSFSDRRAAVTGVNNITWAILDHGPRGENYWDAWDKVLDDAVITDDRGVKYMLHWEGDLWLIPLGMVWSDKTESYEWPHDQIAERDHGSQEMGYWS